MSAKVIPFPAKPNKRGRKPKQAPPDQASPDQQAEPYYLTSYRAVEGGVNVSCRDKFGRIAMEVRVSARYFGSLHWPDFLDQLVNAVKKLEIYDALRALK